MKRIVIKIGSSSLIKGTGLNEANMRALVEAIASFKQRNVAVVLVTSGAIAAGQQRVGLKRKPDAIEKKQALAAIGQPILMEEYERLFDEYGLKIAQILVNHDDFGSRTRLKHLSDAFEALLGFGVVPIVNENDALTVDEIKVGDNDTLSAMVSLVVGADRLVLITDVDGLYDGDPGKDDKAKLIERVEVIDERIVSLAGGSRSSVGTGGMKTKIKAASIAAFAGIETQIANVKTLSELYKITEGKSFGTVFAARKKELSVKQCWLLACATKKGSITVDDGARSALFARKSLLSCGVVETRGNFSSGDAVSVVDEAGAEIAVGITYLSAQETLKYKRDKNKIVIHANNLALRG